MKKYRVYSHPRGDTRAVKQALQFRAGIRLFLSSKIQVIIQLCLYFVGAVIALLTLWVAASGIYSNWLSKIAYDDLSLYIRLLLGFGIVVCAGVVLIYMRMIGRWYLFGLNTQDVYLRRRGYQCMGSILASCSQEAVNQYRLSHINNHEATKSPKNEMNWDDFQSIAHRGFSSRYPENTVESFERAIEAGATMIETDIQWVDDALIVAHDRVAARTDSTLLLEEVLVQVRYKSLYYLEFKTEDLDPSLFPLALDSLDALLRQYGVKKQCMLVSFDLRFLLQARERGWSRLGVNHERVKKPFDAFNCINHEKIDQQLSEPTYAWTINDEQRMNQLIEWGVQGIVTDDVDCLTRVLKNVKKGRVN